MAGRKTNEAGADIDSYCGRIGCKSVLAHVIHAMDGEKPGKVECKTCGAVHKYRAKAPGTRRASAKKATASKTPQTTESEYELKMADLDVSKAKKYDFKETYAEDDLIEHKMFGTGLVTGLVGIGKINIMFREGTKLMAHGR